MYGKNKIVARVEETSNGKKVYFFQDRGEPKQVVMETGIQKCFIRSSDSAEIKYSDVEFLHPIGIIAQVCVNCRSKPGNEEGGCKAYYREKK